MQALHEQGGIAVVVDEVVVVVMVDMHV